MSHDYWKGSRYEAGQKYKVKSDHTFTAKWKKDPGGSKDDGTGHGNGRPDGTKTGDEGSVLLWSALVAGLLLLIWGITCLRRKSGNP